MGLIEQMQADRSEHSQDVSQRVIGGVPWRLRPWDNPYWKFNQGGPVHPTRAFYGVDHAIGLPALYSCVRLLAESLASLPLKIYTRAPGGTGSPTLYTGPSIFDNPSSNCNLYDWLFQCMTALVLHGNAWGWIVQRDGYQYPTMIDWIPPDMVTVVDDPQQPWNKFRTRVYIYGREIPNWREDLFHIKAFTLPGRTEGISPLRAFALVVMQGMEAQRYGTDWFAAGGFPPGTFQNNELEIDSDAAHQIREDLTAAIRNRQPLVYGRDWDYKPVVVPPSEAQFIEATQMNATQLAAVYGLPPDRVGGRRGDSLTYNTVEQSTLQVIEALRPWLVRLETAFFDILPNNRYCRFNSDALLKTDLKTRTEIYMQQRAMGLRTVDELRDLEDLEPMPGGAGNEAIPLEVMVAMSRSIRGIPKSMMGGIELEMNLAADKLEELEKEGLAMPDTLPAAPSASSLVGTMVGTARGLEDDRTEDVLEVVRDLLQRGVEHKRSSRRKTRKEDLLNRVMAIVEQQDGEEAAGELLRSALQEAGKPEFIGPWIPSEDDLARLAATGGNGNGSH